MVMISYTVRPGDTLSTIAQSAYGDPDSWRFIYDANIHVIGSNPDRIEPGMKLNIPHW